RPSAGGRCAPPGFAGCRQGLFSNQRRAGELLAMDQRNFGPRRTAVRGGKTPRPAPFGAGGVVGALWTVLGRTDEPRMTRFLAAQLGTSHYFNISAAPRHFGNPPQFCVVGVFSV